jgi:hypothetical protein
MKTPTLMQAAAGISILLVAALCSGFGDQTLPNAGGVTSRPPNLNVAALHVFWRNGDQTPEGIEFRKRFGAAGQSSNRVESLEALQKRALDAFRAENREVGEVLNCSINVSFDNEQIFFMVLNSSDGFSHVTFDSWGRIQRIGGAKGMHGEGAWDRDFRSANTNKVGIPLKR